MFNYTKQPVSRRAVVWNGRRNLELIGSGFRTSGGNAQWLFLMWMACLVSGCTPTQMEVTVRPLNTPLIPYPPLEMSVLEISVSDFPSERFRIWLHRPGLAELP